MTATHPPVLPLKPVRTGRAPLRAPADEVAPESATDGHAHTQEHVDTDPTVDTELVTQRVFSGVLIGLRIAAFAVLAMVIYLAWADNWVGSAADAVVTWYTTTVAPHLQVDFLGAEVPTVHDGLVGPMNEPSLVTTD